MLTTQDKLLENILRILQEIYMFIKPSHCIPQTYKMLHVNYITIKLECDSPVRKKALLYHMILGFHRSSVEP